MKKILLRTVLILGTISGFSSNAVANDDYCREYTKTINIGGHEENAYGTACLRPDGSWEIMSLEGTNEARNKVRNIIYDDIERHVNYKDREHIIVRESYHSAPLYYKPYNRFQSVQYKSWPYTYHLTSNKHKSPNKKHKSPNKKHKSPNKYNR